MAENILVVEYEPRYTDRVRQALATQPLELAFAKDGEEALRAIDSKQPNLIIMTAVVPKISATELIKAIRARAGMVKTPILLTVSGYTGRSPIQDAQKIGATDLLPKPYSESDLLAKVAQMLGLTLGPGAATSPIPGDILGEVRTAAPKKTRTDDLDKLLADTLSGVRPAKKPTSTSPGNIPVPTPPPAAAPAPAAPKPAAPAEAKGRSAADLDRLLNDTLSGLEKSMKKAAAAPIGQAPTAEPPAAPSAPQPAAAQPPAQKAPEPQPAPKPVAPPAAAPAPAPAVSAAEPAKPAPAPAGTVLSQQAVPAPEPVKEEEDEPTDGTRFGQYVLLDRIATGGMAEVWKARMRGVEGFQKTVAIKKILPHLSDNQDFIEMFIDEAKLAAQLSHNNIIHIYDLGKIQSSYYIAMEYVEGSDLKTILRKAQERDLPMSVELAVFVASKVAAALDYAHRKRDFQDQDIGLVHRDVSPQNVLISDEGDIKLCDFGIAKAASKASHTQAGALKGKLQYMSPEQAWGRNIDKRSDIFALAVVLFEMLTGRKLFAGENEISILDMVRDARVTPPSEYNDEVSPEIDRVVLKALEKDPDSRYQTAGELARDLDSILYSFKPTPTSADLAIFMHRLAAPVPVMPAAPVIEANDEPEEPVIEEPKIIIPAPAAAAAPAAVSMPSWDKPAESSYETSSPLASQPFEEEKKKAPVGLIAAAAVVVLAVGGGFFMMKGKGDAAPAPATPTTTSVAASATPGMQPPGVTQTAATATAAPVPTATSATTSTAIDPKLIDAEVQKRLAAERTKLEQQQKAQQAAATPVPAQAVPAPAPARPAQQPPVTQQEPAQETRPAPAPVQQQPPPQVAETPRQAAPEPEPAQQRVREGDLVQAGTEGLVMPRILKRAAVPYPPIAKVQRVEGTVICNVLVSESGRVLDVKVVRGVNRPGGLNEAAVQMMKLSTFAPGTKDGVRVKAWTTVPVDFKL